MDKPHSLIAGRCGPLTLRDRSEEFQPSVPLGKALLKIIEHLRAPCCDSRSKGTLIDLCGIAPTELQLIDIALINQGQPGTENVK